MKTWNVWWETRTDARPPINAHRCPARSRDKKGDRCGFTSWPCASPQRNGSVRTGGGTLTNHPEPTNDCEGGWKRMLKWHHRFLCHLEEPSTGEGVQCRTAPPCAMARKPWTWTWCFEIHLRSSSRKANPHRHVQHQTEREYDPFYLVPRTAPAHCEPLKKRQGHEPVFLFPCAVWPDRCICMQLPSRARARNS